MLIVACFTILICYWIVTLIKEHLSPLNRIPEPPRYPFLCHFPYFFKAKDKLTLILDWCDQFKSFRMFKLKTLIGKLLYPGTADIVVVLLKSEDIKKVLSKPDIFPRSKFLSTFVPLVGKGLLNSSGAEHRRQKKFFAQAFTMSHMKYFVPVFNKHAKVLTEVWQELVQGEENGRNLTVIDYFSNMALDAVGELSFGYHFNCQRTENKFGNLLKRHLAGLLDLKGRLFLKIFPILWYVPFGPAKMMKDSNEEMDKWLDEVISTRVKKIVNGTLTETEEKDLLNMMIVEMRQTGGFTEQLIKDSSFTFLAAGNDTTATGLPGVLLYLSKHPLLQEKVREEINSLVFDVDAISLEELSNLSYTEAFIKESLRLFQPAPQNLRVCAEDYHFGEYLVPKGTGLLMPHLYIHEGEADFEKGKEFIPERFLGNGLKHGTLLTFGYGPYSCIGKHFALIEMKVTIVQLLKKFKFSIDPGCEKFQRQHLITLKTFPDLQFRVKLL